MEWTSSSAILSGVCFSILVLLLTRSTKKARKLPPGPPGWPVIGNLLDLGATPHRSFANLSHKYGPVMWLRLGTINTMVVSSAEAAMEMFKNHDHHLSGRTSFEAVKVHDFDKAMIVWQQYGPRWRMLRRLLTTELTAKSRVNHTQHLRAKCVNNMIGLIREEAQERGMVQIRRIIIITTYSIVGSVAFSKDNITDPKFRQGTQYLNMVTQIVQWVGKPNVADYFPWLRWLDPQGIKKSMHHIILGLHNYGGELIKERVLERQKGETNTTRDMLDVMLEYRGTLKDEPPNLSERDITTTITETFLGATDTTAGTLERAMIELLKNPNVMRKLQSEIDRVVGFGNKVEEGHIEKLEYLQAVVKETLRLHPIAPLLAPRRSVEDVIFMGYSVPKNTQIVVNVWAIGRDPTWWEDPSSFKPERFLGSNIDFKGQHFHFLPFGAGRRICVGLELGQRMLYLILGSLVHSFDWSLPNGIAPEEIDMSERFGMVLQLVEPLMVVPKPRVAQESSGSMTNIISE